MMQILRNMNVVEIQIVKLLILVIYSEDSEINQKRCTVDSSFR